MASVWYRIDDEARTLRPMAENGHTGGLDALRQLNISWGDNDHGRGVIAQSIRSGQAGVARDMLNDPNYAVWRPHWPPYASAVACPIP